MAVAPKMASDWGLVIKPSVRAAPGGAVRVDGSQVIAHSPDVILGDEISAGQHQEALG
jgi:hypothetical protein